MTTLPGTERLLLGPGPSRVSPRVMRAMAAPVLGHLDPGLLALMDDIRAHLAALFGAPEGTLTLAVSGTGTAAMETCVANLVEPGRHVAVVANGYFGERIAAMAERYGATVDRIAGEWGRAVDPAAVEVALDARRPDLVAVVHAETSTGVRNPVQQIAAIARRHDALVLVDTVTSLGGMPVEMAAWGADACYSGSQKCLGAPSGLAPVAFAPRARERRVRCRSFYLDLALLEDYWVGRKYHHTIAATLVYGLIEALRAIEDEGLAARHARHERVHGIFAAGLQGLGLGLLPPPAERLCTLNAVTLPAGVDDLRARAYLRDRHDIEIGAGMGPLAGRIWRVGLMGASAEAGLVLHLLAALEDTLRQQGHDVAPGGGVGAALAAIA